ncbi:MAG: trypsin-like peptidase domain-containing protein [Acidimicrobiales bacterium]
MDRADRRPRRAPEDAMPTATPVAPSAAGAEPLPPPPGHGSWWPVEPPPEPPYVDGPLAIPVHGGHRPEAFVWVPESPTPPTPPPTTPVGPGGGRRPVRRAALVALAAVAAVIAAGTVGLTRQPDSTSIAQSSPSSTAPPSTTTPSTRPAPSTTVPSTPPSSAAPRTPRDPSTGNGGANGGRSGSTAPSTTSPRSSTTDWDAVAARVDPSVVDLQTKLPNGVGAGTGIVISADGYVVTNNHVVDGGTQLVATRVTTGETFAATVVATDPTHDVALVHLADAHDLPAATLADSDQVQVGDEVAAIGNAGGVGGTPDVAPGQVTGLHQSVTAADLDGTNARTLTDLLQVDANVQPGDSGGPLVDAEGKVIGIDVAASVSRRGTSTEGFAIPINRARSIADQLKAHPSTSDPSAPKVGSGYLGVAIDDSTGARGAAVSSVQAGGPAADAGIVAGDVITAVDRTAVADGAALTSALSGHRGGDRVAITVERSDGRHQLTVTLGSR